jgi:hypothetical protein
MAGTPEDMGGMVSDERFRSEPDCATIGGRKVGERSGFPRYEPVRGLRYGKTNEVPARSS